MLICASGSSTKGNATQHALQCEHALSKVASKQDVAPLTAVFVFVQFFAQYTRLLQSTNYVTRRQSLKVGPHNDL